MVRFFCWISHCKSTHTNSRMYCQMKMELLKYQKISGFSCSLETYSQFLYHNRKQGYFSFAFRKTVFSHFIKIHTIFCIPWAGTAPCPPPCALVSPQTVLIAHWRIVVAKRQMHAQAGQGCSVGQTRHHDGMGQGVRRWDGQGLGLNK